MANPAVLERDVIQALRGCYDPEIPVDIYELGLVYGIRVGPDGAVDIRMTLTAPSCPAAQELPAQVERAVRALPGVTGANRPLRAIDHSTRQAPRVARSQYVWQRNVPQNFALRVVRATSTRRGR